MYIENPFLIGSQLAGSKLLLIFSSNVPSPQQLDLKVSTEGNNSLNQDELVWSNPWNNTCSKLWELALPKGVSSVVISSSKNIMKQFDLPELRLNEGEIKKKIPAHFDAETQVLEFTQNINYYEKHDWFSFRSFINLILG